MANKGRMSSGAWKVCLLLLAALAAGLLGVCAFSSPGLLGPAQGGTLGIQVRQEQVFGSRRVVVTAVDAASPLARAGIVPGDLLQFEHYNDAFGTATADEAVALRLWRAGQAQRINVHTVPLQRAPDGAAALLELIALAAALVFALLAGLRRADSLACRALACYFVGTVFIGLAPLAVPGWHFALARVAGSLYYLTWGSLAVFAIYYPDKAPRGLRRLFAQAVPAMLTCVIFVTALGVAVASGAYIPNMGAVAQVVGGLTLLVILVATWDSWRASEGQMRERLLWMLAALVPLAVLSVTAEALRAGAPGSFGQFESLYRLATIAAHALLVYAVLGERVLHFSYAANRALVLVTVSLFVLLVFGVTELALDRLARSQGIRPGIVADAVVALLVILSFDRIQNWISQRITRTFFHGWHAAASRLRHFMSTAVHIDDSMILLGRFASAVDTYTGYTGAAIYALRADGSYVLRHSSLAGARPLLRSNDEMVLKLRQRRATIVLDGDTKVALAMPMKIRGEVAGFVLAGAKALDEPYRPDEILLLSKAAHHLGLNLESLRVQELEQQVASLTQERLLLEREAAALHRVVTAAALQMPELKS
jgi:hypothetical protein